MKQLAFCVYDEKAEVFGPPFFTSAIGLASRQMSELANDKSTTVGKYPADFKLYHIGYYETQEGKFNNNEVPVFIGAGTDYVEIAPLREVK